MEEMGMATARHKTPELEFMEAHCKALGKPLKDLTVDSLTSLFGHVYHIWRTFRPALGEEKGLKYYGNVWGELARISFRNAMTAFGLKEVKDLQTLGRIVKFAFTGVPALYVTKRDEKDEHVGHILWCANPAYGPPDSTFCRHDYYRQEIYLTYVYIWAMIEEAKKNGLGEEVLVDVPSGRCRDGAACACQIILRTHNANPDRPLPEIENTFVDLEMGDVEPVVYILEKQKRTLEEQGPGSFIGFFAVDFLAWLQLFQHAKRQARDVYLALWRTFPPMWVKAARLDLEIGRINAVKELADVIAYCQKKKYIAYEVASSSDKGLVLTSKADPFVQVADMLQAPEEYKKALFEMDKDFVVNVIKETKMDKRTGANFTSHIATGGRETTLELTVR
jgi:hypothetical protein